MRTQGEARSKETTFSGLPKSVKLSMQVRDPVVPAVNAFTQIRYDRVTYNYGGYVITPDSLSVAGRFNAVVIPEPGIYRLEGNVGIIANTQTAYICISFNGVNDVAPDGNRYAVSEGAFLNNGVFFVIYHVHATVELKQGDIVGMLQNQASAAPQAIIETHTHFTVTKEGGQY